MSITIYHNPECGTSRNTLAMIRQSGVEPTIVEYLKTPPGRQTVKKLIADAGLSVRQAVRRKDTPFDALGLGDRRYRTNSCWTRSASIPFCSTARSSSPRRGRASAGRRKSCSRSCPIRISAAS